MEILGIGPMEILFILILVFIIFGPQDMKKAGKTMGQGLNKIIRSDSWKTISQTSREIKNLPDRLMREAGMEYLEKTVDIEYFDVNKLFNESIDTDSSSNSPLGSAGQLSFPVDVSSISATEQERVH